MNINLIEASAEELEYYIFERVRKEFKSFYVTYQKYFDKRIKKDKTLITDIGNYLLKIFFEDACLRCAQFAAMYEEENIIRTEIEKEIRHIIYIPKLLVDILAKSKRKNVLLNSITKQKKKHKIFQSALSEVSYWRCEVAEYLHNRYPKCSFNPKQLHEIDSKYKEVGRKFLESKLGNAIQRNNIKKEVFKKSKPSIRKSEPTYSIGKENNEEIE